MHLKSRIVLLLSVCGVAGVPGSLEAQARDTIPLPPPRLPPIDITASLISRVGPGIATLGGPVIVMPRDPLSVRGARLLPGFVATGVGASLYDDLGSRVKPTLVMRGFAVSPVVGLPQGISVFLDGIPVNEVDAGQVNLEMLPFDELRQVELLSSTTALLGPNTMGGAINLVTRQGGEQFEGELSAARGSFGALMGHGYAAGSLARWQLYGALASDEEEGWRQQTSSRVQRVLVNAARGNADRRLRLQLLAARSRGQTAGSLPESVYGIRPDSNLTGGDFEDLSQLHLAASGSLVNRGIVSWSAWLRDLSAERFNVNQVNDPDVRSFSRTRTAGTLLDWQAERPIGPETSLHLRAGTGASFSESQLQIYAERVDPRITTNVHTPITRFDAFAEGNARHRRLTVSGGLRQDVVRVPFRNRIDPRRDTTSLFTALNPRGSLSFDVTPSLRVWTGIVQSFRAPAVIEIACADPEEPCPLPFALGDDPPIDPVRALTREVGTSWQRGLFRADATAFRTDVRDEIFLFPYSEDGEPEGSTIDGFFANVPRTRREGFELSAAMALTRLGELSLRFNRTEATFRTGGLELFSIREAAGEENEVEIGDRLPLVPDRTFNVGFRSAPQHRVRAGVETRWTGRRWLRGDEANDTAPLQGYWLTDAHSSLRLGLWQLQATVRNLANARYAAFGTFNINQGAGDRLERFLTPGEPRALQLTVTRRFGVAGP